ncbi:MAG TPA: hypothetical protein VE709_09175, partial [Pseudonocardiaceae bacterium]|nr:hypothetical protein [Pseudonocardiaceae bacterium]
MADRNVFPGQALSWLRSVGWLPFTVVIARRHKRSRAYGWSVLAYQSPDHFGLISLSGTVVAPRPF